MKMMCDDDDYFFIDVAFGCLLNFVVVFFGVFVFLFVFAYVNDINPMMLIIIPPMPIYVMDMLNTIDVTTMANILRIQFNTAWYITLIRDKIYVDAKL